MVILYCDAIQRQLMEIIYFCGLFSDFAHRERERICCRFRKTQQAHSIAGARIEYYFDISLFLLILILRQKTFFLLLHGATIYYFAFHIFLIRSKLVFVLFSSFTTLRQGKKNTTIIDGAWHDTSMKTQKKKKKRPFSGPGMRGFIVQISQTKKNSSSVVLYFTITILLCLWMSMKNTCNMRSTAMCVDAKVCV